MAGWLVQAVKPWAYVLKEHLQSCQTVCGSEKSEGEKLVRFLAGTSSRSSQKVVGHGFPEPPSPNVY